MNRYFKMEVLKLLKGITFCLLWYFSIFFGCLALYCPLVPLILFNTNVFRTLTDRIFAFWELYPTALMRLFGTKIFVHGDYVNPKETAIVVMNHRTRVDWNYMWMCMFHASRKPAYVNDHLESKYSKADKNGRHLQNGGHAHQNGGSVQMKNYNNGRSKAVEEKRATWSFLEAINHKLRMKYVLKDEIRHIPGPGWVMQMSCFIYIKRNWQHDETEINKVLQYFKDMDYTYQILIFPEGTDLTPDSMKKSDSFAKKNNLEPYQQVLHPRTRGFSHLAKALQPGLQAVYDVTVGYSGFPGKQGCSLRDLAIGNFPPEVHFYIKRYSANLLPDGEEPLGSWLSERWKCKEEQLKSFYKHGRFVDAVNRLEHAHNGELIFAFVFWTLLIFLCIFAMIESLDVRVFFAIHCVIFPVLGISSRGFHHMEMACFELKQRLFSRNSSKKN